MPTAPGAIHGQLPWALGTVCTLFGGDIPNDLGAALHQKHIAVDEVGEEQRGARIEQQITERVEVAVSAVVGDGQRIAVDLTKPGLPAR